jgi:hypothetical protein
MRRRARFAEVRPGGESWVVRYLSEGTPSWPDVAKVTQSAAEPKRDH